jgi:hypothetical protein
MESLRHILAVFCIIGAVICWFGVVFYGAKAYFSAPKPQRHQAHARWFQPVEATNWEGLAWLFAIGGIVLVIAAMLLAGVKFPNNKDKPAPIRSIDPTSATAMIDLSD